MEVKLTRVKFWMIVCHVTSVLKTLHSEITLLHNTSKSFSNQGCGSMVGGLGKLHGTNKPNDDHVLNSSRIIEGLVG